MEKRSDQGKTPAEAEVDHVVANKEEEEEATELKKDKTRKTKMVRLTQVQIDYCIAVHNANNKPMAATKKGVPKFTEVLSPAQLAEVATLMLKWMIRTNARREERLAKTA